jgi:hypothetical protein
MPNFWREWIKYVDKGPPLIPVKVERPQRLMTLYPHRTLLSTLSTARPSLWIALAAHLISG